MAKIIRKGHQLENEYRGIENEREQQGKDAGSAFLKVALFAILAVAVFALTGNLRDNAVSFKNSAIVIGAIVFFGFIIVRSSPDSYREADSKILASGIEGERIAANILSRLSDEYVVYQDVVISYGGGSSEIDNIVVGPSGVFAVETKNHNGNIVGNYEEHTWEQEKIGRGGSLYSEELHSPVKQIGTHIYRLANYLRDNGVQIYVEGAVLFTNAECSVRVYGNGEIPVFSVAQNEADSLLKFILNGRAHLDGRAISQICRLLSTT